MERRLLPPPHFILSGSVPFQLPASFPSLPQAVVSRSTKQVRRYLRRRQVLASAFPRPLLPTLTCQLCVLSLSDSQQGPLPPLPTLFPVSH